VPEYLTPGVYFEYRDAAPAVRGVRTDIAGFVGLAARGPVNRPVRVESWRQYQAQFGDFVPYGFLAYAVKGFFENGGRTCYVVRVAGAAAQAAAYVLRNKAGEEVLRLSARDEGTWGNRLGFSLVTRPAAGEFSLIFANAGSERESFQRLSLDPASPRHFARLINEGDERTARSRWFSISVVAGLAPGTDLLPDASESGLSRGSGLLSGGKDGLASLTRQDFVGDASPLAEPKKGLSALERVDAVGIVCVPDIHIQPASPLPPPPPEEEPPRDPCRPRKGQPVEVAPPEPPPGAQEEPPVFGAADVLAVGRAMIEHCELMRDRVAILDAPVKPGGVPLSVAEIQDWRAQLNSDRGFGALYYPWLRVVDPLRANRRPVRDVPPSGHVAGLYARTDLAAGVHQAPANGELHWAADVTVAVNDETQGVLNPLGINCVRAFPGRGIRAYGARTVSSDPAWRYVNVRRLLLMIEEAVDEATQWAVFEPHDFRLRQTLTTSVSSFLETVWRGGALVGTTAKEAFFVKCDETTNPPEVVEAGRVVTEVGVAPTIPAEFIVFRVGRTVAELEVVER
jgi:phage tail sheath protein FI